MNTSPRRRRLAANGECFSRREMHRFPDGGVGVDDS